MLKRTKKIANEAVEELAIFEDDFKTDLREKTELSVVRMKDIQQI